MNVIQSHLDTNLSVEELVALVGFAAQVNRSNTKMLMIPGRFSAPGEYKASYWLPQPEQIRSLVAKHFDFGTPNLEQADTSSLKVAIQDSTQQDKPVQSAIATLRTAGYNNIYMSQNWNEPLSTTRIVAEWGDVSSAEAVRRALGFGEVRIENTGDLQSDITIQLGKDALQGSKKTVQTRKAETSQTGKIAN